MINAKLANIKSSNGKRRKIKQEFKQIKKEIKYAIYNGENSIYVFRIYEGTIKQLRELGYKVEYKQEYHRGFKDICLTVEKYVISW